MAGFPRVRDLIRSPIWSKRLAGEITLENPFSTVLLQTVIPSAGSSNMTNVHYLSIPNFTEQVATTVSQTAIPPADSAKTSNTSYLTVPSS